MTRKFAKVPKNKSGTPLKYLAGLSPAEAKAKEAEMKRTAKKAKADYIKFQIYNIDEIAVSNLKKAPYQKKNSTNKNEKQNEMLKK